MSDIFVVRHGAYSRPESGEELTTTGRMQAESAGYGLQAVSPNARWQLVSSDEPRAAQTAEIIGRIVNATPILSRLIARAGDYVEDAAAFETRIRTALEEGGEPYDEHSPLAVVGHLPLLACVAGDPRAEIGNGEMVQYTPEMWDGSAAEL
jgi:phosphohistidine phosphatase SixA